MDLWHVKKIVDQRANRHPSNKEAMLCREVFKKIVAPGTDEAVRLGLAEKFSEIESSMYCIRRRYGPRAVAALKSGDYTIDIPYQIRHRMLEDDDAVGYVYIAVSPCHPAEFKVGATSNDVATRLCAYRKRYKEPISEFWSYLAFKPFAVERVAQRLLTSVRVSALTHGESNEWYVGDPKLGRKSLQDAIEQRDA